MATSTIDPAKALNEMQPWQVNQEKPTTTLSSIVHRDIWGNEIKEPDLTNPTRNRWERPLDTIRGFQESIDRGYRRSYYGGDDGESHVGANRPQHTGNSSNNDHYYPHSQRMGNSATPLSNNSVEDHGFGTGAMNSHNVLNDSLVINQGRPNNYSNNNNGYNDANGYNSGYSSDQGYGNGGGPSYTTTRSPLQQQQSMPSPSPLSPQQSTPRTIQLGGSSSTPASAPTPAPAPTPAAVTAGKKERKSWLGKKLSKNK